MYAINDAIGEMVALLCDSGSPFLWLDNFRFSLFKQQLIVI